MKKKKKEQANKVSFGLPGTGAGAEGETFSSSEKPSTFVEAGARSKRVMFNRLNSGGDRQGLHSKKQSSFTCNARYYF